MEVKRQRKYLKKDERRTLLEQDEWSIKVEAKRVLCKGCREWIALNPQPKREYVVANWETHKTRCDQITGFKTVTQAVVSRTRSGTFEVSVL